LPKAYRLQSMDGDVMDYDDLGIGEESPSEKLARENMEADLRLLSELRRIREERGLSQKALGEILGVSQATVSAFEAEEDPKLSTIRRYAQALCVSVAHEAKAVEFTTSWSGRFSASSTGAPGQFSVLIGAAETKRNDFAVAA
jgi:transcriptional regulator with XRE-family HTH domain